MTLETDATAVAADATTVVKAITASSILSDIKSLAGSILSKIPTMLSMAGTLLMPTSMVIKGIVLAAVMAIPVGTYMKGRSDANKSCIEQAAKAHAKNVKAYAKLKKSTAKMGKSQLDSSLSKFVR
jgi:hypothetical protein